MIGCLIFSWYRIENNIEECQAIGNPISAIPLIPKTGEKLP
jgi:hypothetical protein